MDGWGVEVLLRSVAIKQGWDWVLLFVRVTYRLLFLYFALSDGVLGFIPLALFT